MARQGSPAYIGEERRYLLNKIRMTAGSLGLPLHIVDGSGILHSFGMEADVRSPTGSHRVLEVDRQGRIYSAQPDDYLIQVWNESGRRILGLRGPRLNEREASSEPWSPDNPPRNQILAMQVDDEQQLWVISVARRDDWQDHMEERVMPNGRIVYGPTDDDPRKIFQSRIDLIDLTSGSLIATSLHDALIEAFVEDGLGLENEASEQNHPRMVICSLHFNPFVEAR